VPTGDRALLPLRESDGSPIVAPRVLRRLAVIAEAIFATEAGPPPAERIAWVVTEAEDFLARSGSRTRVVVGFAILGVSVFAPLLARRFTSLAGMTLAERIFALRQLENSKLAGPLFAVKALLSLFYYEHPDAAREVGFDGACLGIRS
jgi:hypothetical protein